MHGWGGGISGLQHLVRDETQAAVGLDMPQAALDPDTTHGVSVLGGTSHQSKFVNPHEYQMFMARCRADSPHDQMQKNLWDKYIGLKEQTLVWLAKLPQTSPQELQQYIQDDVKVTKCPVSSALPAHFVVEEAFGRNPITPPISTAQPKSNQQYKVLVLTPKDQPETVLGAFRIQTNTKSAHDGSDIEHGDEIGINIECQKFGLGSILLREALRQCEKDTFEINASVDPGFLSLYIQQFGGQVVDLTRRLQGDGTYITKYRIRFDAKKSSQINLQEKEKLGAGFSTLNATRLQSLASQLTDLNLVWEPIHHWEPNQSSTPNIQEAIRRIEQSLQSLGDQGTYIVSCPTPLTRELELVLYMTCQHLLKTHLIDGYATEGAQTKSTEMVYRFRKKPEVNTLVDTIQATEQQTGRLPNEAEQAEFDRFVRTVAGTGRLEYFKALDHYRPPVQEEGKKYFGLIHLPAEIQAVPPDKVRMYHIRAFGQHAGYERGVSVYECDTAEAPTCHFPSSFTSKEAPEVDIWVSKIHTLLQEHLSNTSVWWDPDEIRRACTDQIFVLAHHQSSGTQYNLYVNWKHILDQLQGVPEKKFTVSREVAMRALVQCRDAILKPSQKPTAERKLDQYTVVGRLPDEVEQQNFTTFLSSLKHPDKKIFGAPEYYYSEKRGTLKYWQYRSLGRMPDKKRKLSSGEVRIYQPDLFSHDAKIAIYSCKQIYFDTLQFPPVLISTRLESIDRAVEGIFTIIHKHVLQQQGTEQPAAYQDAYQIARACTACAVVTSQQSNSGETHQLYLDWQTLHEATRQYPAIQAQLTQYIQSLGILLPG